MDKQKEMAQLRRRLKKLEAEERARERAETQARLRAEAAAELAKLRYRKAEALRDLACELGPEADDGLSVDEAIKQAEDKAARLRAMALRLQRITHEMRWYEDGRVTFS